MVVMEVMIQVLEIMLNLMVALLLKPNILMYPGLLELEVK
jgi:hypothetical protein